MFKKGESGNPSGGKKGNKGGGRPSGWLKTKCQKIIVDKKLLEWLGSVAAGEPVEEKVYFDNQNNPIKKKIPADTKDRLRALEMLADRAWGKPAQAVNLGDADGNSLPYSINVNFDGK